MTCDKVRYDTYAEGMAAIHEISKRDRQKMKLYPCSDCGGFHSATEGKKKFIKTLHNNNVIMKTDHSNPLPIPRKAVPIPVYGAEKLISKEQAIFLKRLIEGNNNMNKQCQK